MHATAASILRGRVASTHAIQSCVAGYSVEVTPAAAKKVRSFAEVSGLREGTTVNVTFLPGSDVADTVGICERLSDAGMLPVAHLPARSFAGLDQVEDYLRELAGVGVREVLVLAGGAPEPAGALTESLEILRSGLLEKHGMERVGVAAHPEGHPNVSSRVLMSALLDKAEWAKANSTDMYYETQFCFEASPIMVWEGEVRAALKARLGASAVLPEIRLGVAGPAKISSLIRFGILSGVGNSLRFVQKHAGHVFKLAQTSAPDELVAGVGEWQDSDPDCMVKKMHFYPFGGLKPTLRWANAVEAGEFDVSGAGFQVRM